MKGYVLTAPRALLEYWNDVAVQCFCAPDPNNMSYFSFRSRLRFLFSPEHLLAG